MIRCEKCNSVIPGEMTRCLKCAQDSLNAVMYPKLESSSISDTPDYSGSKGLASFVSFLGWICSVLGFFKILIGLAGGLGNSYRSDPGIMMAIVPGLYCIISGLILALFGQSCRATFDAADNTSKLLRELKRDS